MKIIKQNRDVEFLTKCDGNRPGLYTDGENYWLVDVTGKMVGFFAKTDSTYLTEKVALKISLIVILGFINLYMILCYL